jgi:hypothetical protein
VAAEEAVASGMALRAEAAPGVAVPIPDGLRVKCAGVLTASESLPVLAGFSESGDGGLS